MDVREKLVELLDIIIQPGQKTLGDIADHLIDNGVTVQECKLGVKKTNADRIRSMSDERMTVFLDEFSSRCLDCAEYEKNQSCPIYKEGRYCTPKDIMEWLQQPPKGE